MIRGLYALAAALRANIKRQEAVSYNLVNVNTTGFKQNAFAVKSSPVWSLVRLSGEPVEGEAPVAIGALGTGVTPAELSVDLAQGPLAASDRPLDLAIVGDGFFRVQTPAGERYTRDGSFHRDARGWLVTVDGYPVLGDEGPLQIGDGNVTIANDGTVYSDGTRVGRLSLAQIAAQDLRREGDNLLAADPDAVQLLLAAETQVRQGFLEQSNVDLAGSVTAMMWALRAYEANQRILRLQDQTLTQATQVGKPG
ncbi:MAG TPA: flagellar hook basal-body protein [Anaerolineae bacterium]|nr:flagellar hook basal-body protein [Anaerolineae bacterium]HIQ05778.1 flagellar hook basal-body protein [Anaerolineae bacterium]